MAQGLWTTVYGIVLSTGMRFVIGLAVQRDRLLHTQNSLHTQHGIQVGILATRFLTTTPSRIAEDVDVGTPECQFRIARIVGHAHRYIVQLRVVVVRTVPVSTCLVRDLREYVVHQLCIESCSHTNRLWINCVATLTYTVTGLAPPVVAGNAQTVYRYRLVHHQTHLLFRGQHTQQTLHTLHHRKLGVLPFVTVLSLQAHHAHNERNECDKVSFHFCWFRIYGDKGTKKT